jgi:phosphate transport system substrate-binding protein
LVAFGLCLVVLATGCSKSDSPRPAGEAASAIIIDGSSTVFPISQAVAEEFQRAHGTKVAVSLSGTSGGFKQFVLGEIDICDASRPIKDEEMAKCKAADIEYVEFTIAVDGLAVVANPQNDWCDCITIEQLKAMWSPEANGVVMKWSDVNPDWPEEPLKLFGAGTDSGTFDYFTEVICGEEGASRPDYQPSENDNMLVRGVEAEKGALGYFGYAYYVQNKDQLKLLAVDSGSGCVAPDEATVRDGSYHPLSRPLFIYVRKASLEKPAVVEFVKYYLEHAAQLAAEVGYVPVTADVAQQNQTILTEALSSAAAAPQP